MPFTESTCRYASGFLPSDCHLRLERLFDYLVLGPTLSGNGRQSLAMIRAGRGPLARREVQRLCRLPSSWLPPTLHSRPFHPKYSSRHRRQEIHRLGQPPHLLRSDTRD